MLFRSFFLVAAITQLTYAEPTGDLVFVHEVTRHGARESVGSKIDDPDIPFYLEGELTPMGMRQHYLLG